MDFAETEFLESLHGLSKARDKVYEISNTMLSFKNNARQLVAIWLREFKTNNDENKRAALLYIMNDVLIKSAINGNTEIYLKEFTTLFDDILKTMIEARSESLIEEFRKIVMVWEKPETQIFVPQFTAQLKISISEAVNQIQDDKSGASVIQEFELTRKLASLESKHEENLELAKQLDSLCKVIDQSTVAWNTSEIKSQLFELRAKCEVELIERSSLMMEMSELLEEEYQKYINFPEILESINHN